MAIIAVIDDRATNRHILTRLAMHAGEGVQVSAFPGPHEALHKLGGELLPDLIITDFDMPGMDGATFIREMRARDGLVDVPIVVVTIFEDLEYRYKALEAGATDFLLSPVDHVEFKARVRNLLIMRKQQKLLLERARGPAAAPDAPGDVATGYEILAGAIDAMPLAFAMVDLQGRVQLVNRAHETLFSVDRRQVLGRRADEVYGGTVAAQHGAPAAGDGGADACQGSSGDAGSRDLVFLRSPCTDADGRARGQVTVAVDLAALRAGDVPAVDRTGIDPLTGLARLDTFSRNAEQEIALARRQGEMLALMHLDLDRFKGINEAFGSLFADELIRGVSRRLGERLGEGHRIARLPSDEFIVLQTGVRRADDAAAFYRSLTQAFAAPFVIGHQEVHLSVSTGITVYPGDGKTLSSLLKNAELAMYRAKASGRDAYRFFAAEMNVAARRAVDLERELRQSLAADRFVVHYQPQLDLGSGRIIGVEALVRWDHPQRGLVRPGEFIGLAEDIGLIAPLTSWVLQTACRQLRAWQDEGLQGVQLSVNLSPVQFRERGVELLIQRVLKDSGVAPCHLDVELTENAVIENSQTATASLRYLHQLGVTLSIDDFGTGYSSLSYVKRLPVQRLKIDQTFIHNLVHSTHDEVIVRAIINLGHSLGLRVIAEGVETPEQLAKLRRYGCDEVQGHLISHPLAAREIRELLLGETRLEVLGLAIA